MTEDFSTINDNAKFSDVLANAIDYYQQLNNITNNSANINNQYDHIHPKDKGLVEIENRKQKSNCQSAESEVRFLKEWLLLHLDLIQQQNEEILNKERSILLLREENEMLKERLNCMEQVKPEEQNNCQSEITTIKEEVNEDMTQDLGSCDDKKDTLEYELVSDNLEQSELNLGLEENYSELCDINNTQYCETNDNFSSDCSKEQNDELKYIDSSIDSNLKVETETYNFTSKLDSLKNLRMSIRRKRVCSSSSALSRNGLGSEDKKEYRKSRKKRKRSLNEDQILTTREPYVNQVGDLDAGISFEPEPQLERLNQVLEVPRWRVKVYTSCYAMEGTENMDDKVFLRRHNRLEIDERRRKRWDIQRIREQRVIEKLKQRQERIESHFKNENSNEFGTFTHNSDDIEFIEVCDELPITAFGFPLAKLHPEEFRLPWLNNWANNEKKEKQLYKKIVKRKKSKR